MPFENLQYLRNKERQNIINCGYGEKYDHAGVYSISIENKLVYIGKAKNMLNRVVDHILEIGNPNVREYKYEILREAKQKKHKIEFSVLYDAAETSPSEIEREICEKEGELIREHLPPLNYKIPKEENYHQFTINQQAKTITLQEILDL